jgi:LmbE family N-acetylglucosaminyl deacetylase
MRDANATLVLAAHPDDEVLGCGGLIAKSARAGEVVVIAILGEGITSRSSQSEPASAEHVAALKAKAVQVGHFLGAKEVICLGLPDNRFDTIPLLDVAKVIEGVIDHVQPVQVLTQHGSDLNIDHVVTFRAALTATRPTKGTTIKKLMAYEVLSSTDWAFASFEPRFLPNVFVDISSTLDTKLAAMEMYDTEIRPFPHPRSRPAIEAAAKRWGSQIGCEAAEAYQLVWSRE